jgi:hypothetical protein
MNITKTLLKRKGACANQIALFESHFPKGTIRYPARGLPALAGRGSAAFHSV